MNRPAWFSRELPHDWGTGRIEVDGDEHLTIWKLLCACIVSGLLWVGIVALWSLT